ncbi:hypothetical protein EN833_08300 [Mesorhizobium sp. M4B.F.Ca.ET.190.01.1.1]|uniref:hypothetical protein n=1 Tax=unclassified Mesorhizobium TaxID=325217 RepID=UPI000FE3BA17|nr:MULTISPECIES: hypothetical protein [unclassified Mesorhizobium]RWX68013.1 hypothetical protein EN780_10405 [Mesorhizobium sp. M4B.F.Ca.ET.089.01.1.1]TGR13163.1 hypothetical protein EN843_08295 [Mesorhizobium sp. M4B.F.Ca.ET.200.01.1.1]TGS21374.1 hypothetical protein EN833_08300 [Mesorhizobium sp. M4B.F.Ca.ET.190.01.1.1]TGT32937.1 hypothetical protein EN815_10840 [Mesorhizobium sp. M4B.F.Ca.ET.172.01.1.1]
MVASKILALAAFVALAACQHGGGSFCDVEKPNRNPVKDMTATEARSALAHNLKGAKLCGWRP